MSNQEVAGIYALLYAVIERAVLDVTSNHRAILSKNARRNMKTTAHAWIFLPPIDEERLEPFSLDWICEQVDSDPNDVRRMVQEAIEAQAAGDAPATKTRIRWQHFAEGYFNLTPSEDMLLSFVRSDRRTIS